MARPLLVRRIAVAGLLFLLSPIAFGALGEGIGTGVFVGLLCSAGYLWVDSRIRATGQFGSAPITSRDTLKLLIAAGGVALVGALLLILVILFG